MVSVFGDQSHQTKSELATKGVTIDITDPVIGMIVMATPEAKRCNRYASDEPNG
jgi:hypothetical protein